MSSKQIAIILTGLLLGGSGCVATPVSSLIPAQAAEALVLSMGDKIVIQPTVFGLGGRVVGWFGADEEERLITITDWVAGQQVALDWSITRQVETAESLAAREAYEQSYASSPVGVEIPPTPEMVYEDQWVSGSLASRSLASADTLALPESWPEGDGGVSTSSLIWLSQTHYAELVNTRSTIVSIGLFDESLLRVETATSQIASVVDKLLGLFDPILGAQDGVSEETARDADSLLTWEADPQWGEFDLLVDGVKTKVQVVTAKNAFASYNILANPENPLILEIQLTPLSRGNLKLLSPEGFTAGFGGYEVTQINTSSSSVSQPAR